MNANTLQRPSRTKIVATVGPASRSEEMLRALIHAGVDVFRINTAHGSREEHAATLEAVREASREMNQPVAVLVDLAGPKIRLGELPGGQLELHAGELVRFVRDGAAAAHVDRPSPAQTASDTICADEPAAELTATYERLIDELQPGDRVMLADGVVALVVERVERDAACCRVRQPGIIRSRQGINLPGVRLSTPALTPADRDHALWAAAAGADFLGLSFVRRPEDIRSLRQLIADALQPPQIVAKIEKPEAVERLEEIVAAADAVMVARGDLGVEIDIADVPVVQKQIIAVCRALRRPVIVATQMLESMHHSRLPTRAEATDVANAILDGADACMLSGETAVGAYPLEAVATMHAIALATEEYAIARGGPAPLATAEKEEASKDERGDVLDAMAAAAGQVAQQLRAKVIVVASASGRSALALSKNRHWVHTVGVSHAEATLRRMCLYWGVVPVRGAPTDDSGRLLDFVIDRGKQSGLLQPADRVVLLAGSGVQAGGHNMVAVHRVP